MLTQPRKTKYRKQFKGRSKGVETRGVSVSFGEYGLKALEPKWITANQVESCRRAITRALKKKGKVFIRIFPHKPVSRKGAEVPMGGGKGAPDHYVFPVKPGRIIFEIDGVEEELAKEAFKKASIKLPIKTKFVKK